jgi:hypothetical protein
MTWHRADAGNGKVVYDSYDQAGKWRSRNAYCFNPRYAFALRQTARDRPFVVTMKGQDPKTRDKARGAVTSFTRGVWAPYNLDADIRPLSGIVRGNDCSIVDCREITQDGRALVQVDFTFNLTGRLATMPQPKRSASLVLDPTADWRIVSSVLKWGPWTTSTRITYSPTSSMKAAVSTIVGRGISTEGASDDRDIEVTSLSAEATPDKQFNLSAFGLPEPLWPREVAPSITVVSPRPANRTPWVIAALLAIVLFLALVYWQKKRGPGQGTP